jgi:uncharacterized membrane protein YfcA
MTELMIIALAGFLTGITTVAFGFGGGFVVVPFVYHFVASVDGLASNSMHVAVATSTAVMVLNAAYATFLNWRNDALLHETFIPLIYYLSMGAIIGALLATIIPDNAIRMLFIIYLLLTIADCIFREGFIIKPGRVRLSTSTLAIGGPSIGLIAAMLGVGGSVMTVPLLRRHGYEMQYCVTAANPLSIPVAVFGTLTYAIAGIRADLGAYYIGFVNINILMILALFGATGVVVARKWLPKVPDKLHAKVYLFLLVLVLLAIGMD